MIQKIFELTEKGNAIFVAASKPSTITNNNYGFITISAGFYGEAISIFKKRYGHNPFHLRKYIDPSLLQKAVSLHKSICYHEIDLDNPEVEVLDAMRSFSPIYYESKGFALIDICEYSKKSTAEQISQKLILERAFVNATKDLHKTRSTLVEDHHLNFSFHSTGDGFYIWSKSLGRHADSILLAHLLLAIGFLKRNTVNKVLDLEVRAAFGIGEAYIFPRSNSLFPDDALGDVLNDVARIVSFASRNQILLQEFSLEKVLLPNSINDSCALVECIPELFESKTRSYIKLDGMDELLWAEDKHGKRHYFRNLNGDYFVCGPDSEPYNRVQLGVGKERAIPFDPKKFY